ncbi:MAG: type II secretion system GspH family protein [Dehalococcoidia bacterium]|nr:type II secretion system GspH family protein [Dehalococcoidia bacterium]
MKKLRLNSQVRKAFPGSSRGFTLIEVVIAMVLLGIIGVAVLSALSYASSVLIIVDRRATAESLAKSQMEYVKNQSYNSTQPGGIATYEEITPIPDGYTIGSFNRDDEIVEDVIGIPWDSGNNTALYEDNGLQKIKVIIKYDIVRYNITTRGSELVAKNFTLEDYKRGPVT